MKELFLTSLRGIQYGIWKDEILSVRELDALHRIPLSPACIAGILIDDNRTVTLADLPVCIGYESSGRIEQGCILLQEEGEKVMGFVISGELRTLSISTELFFPLPDYLKTPVFGSCAVHNDIPIPLINTSVLHSRVLKPDEEPSEDSLKIFGAQPQNISEVSQIRCFSAGGELFAVSATGIEGKAVKPGPITPLPNTPRYVKGVTFWKGRLLPVIDLTQRIKWQSASPDSQMLIAEIGGAAFGLLIESDSGTVSTGNVAIKPAPFIAQTAWLKHVVVHGGELIPLIDLAMALSPVSVGDEKPAWQQYAPDSVFPDMFFKREAGVVEFSLLGERHALPKDEVEDVIDFKPCRALPDVPPIVIGVAEHKGEIFPVVDLAMMFGRRLLATSAWRMMLVKNGDFRALVITETVFGERQLGLEIHRAMPIHLPHNFMYGCYPDDKAVRIILNVEAITVHFEKSMITKFMPALSHEMKMSPTGILYAFPDEITVEKPDEKIGVTSQLQATETVVGTVAPVRTEETPVQLAEAESISVAISAASSSAESAETIAEPEYGQYAGHEEVVEIHEKAAEVSAIATDPEPEQEPEESGVAHAAVASAGTADAISSSGEWSESDADEAVPGEMMKPEPVAFNKQPSGEEFIASAQHDSVAASSQATQKFQPQTEIVDAELIEEQRAETTAPATTVQPQQPSIPQHTDQQPPGESKVNEPVAKSEPPPGKILKFPIQKDPAQKTSETGSAKSRTSEPVRPAVGAKPSASYRMSREVEQLAILSGHEAAMVRARQRRIFFGALVTVLVAAIFYYAGTSDKPVVEKTVTVTEPAKIEQAKVEPVPVKTKAELAKEKAELAKVQAAQAKLEAAQAKARAKAEREAKLKAEQEARLKAAQEARAKAEQEKLLAAQAKAQAKAEQEARLKAAQEARAKAEQEKLLAAQAKAQAKAEHEAQLKVAQEAKAQARVDQANAKIQQTIVLTKPSSAENLRAPLELDIPKSMPQVDIDVYVVVQGDTLWGISERFTGDPFNYPRIAGENRIANPDLIFPDQRIKLIK